MGGLTGGRGDEGVVGEVIMRVAGGRGMDTTASSKYARVLTIAHADERSAKPSER